MLANEFPADTSPADEIPADESPADEMLADEFPEDTSPADTSLADPVFTDVDSSAKTGSAMFAGDSTRKSAINIIPNRILFKILHTFICFVWFCRSI